jgi:hypothetical protein
MRKGLEQFILPTNGANCIFISGQTQLISNKDRCSFQRKLHLPYHCYEQSSDGLRYKINKVGEFIHQSMWTITCNLSATILQVMMQLNYLHSLKLNISEYFTDNLWSRYLIIWYSIASEHPSCNRQQGTKLPSTSDSTSD